MCQFDQLQFGSVRFPHPLPVLGRGGECAPTCRRGERVDRLRRIPEDGESGAGPARRRQEVQQRQHKLAPNSRKILELVHDQVAPVADQRADRLPPPASDQPRQLLDVLVVPSRQQSGRGIPEQPEHPERPRVEGADGDVPQLLEDPVVRAVEPGEAVGQVPYRTPGEAEHEQLAGWKPLPYQAGHADRRHLRLAGAGTRRHEKPGARRRAAYAFPLRFIWGTHHASSSPETANDPKRPSSTPAGSRPADASRVPGDAFSASVLPLRIG